MTEIKNLLERVLDIQKKYDEIATITGENFNIFSVMKMERREVKTHSSFLRELLNPKGSHGLNDAFLKLFIKEVFEDKLDEFETASANAITEEYISQITEDKTAGGRVDIVIKDAKGNVILIENKIDAYEQKNQLLRYRNAYPQAKILFLTLTGYDSNTASAVEHNQKDYISISYEIHIVKWLEICLKEAVKYPMLREVIQQYIYLLKKLTHQTTNNKMSKEIKELILKNLESSKEIYNSINQLNKELDGKLNDLIKLSKESDFIDDINSEITKINQVVKWEVSGKFPSDGYNMYKYTIYRSNNLPEIVTEVFIRDDFAIETNTYINDSILMNILENTYGEYNYLMDVKEISKDLQNRLLAILRVIKNHK